MINIVLNKKKIRKKEKKTIIAQFLKRKLIIKT